MAKMRKVKHIQGVAKFLDENSVEVELINGEKQKLFLKIVLLQLEAKVQKCHLFLMKIQEFGIQQMLLK